MPPVEIVAALHVAVRERLGRLGAEPQGEVGKLLNEMVRSIAFEMTMDISDGTLEATPKMVKDLSIAIERLEKAASENVKRDAEIRILQRQLLDANEAVRELQAMNERAREEAA